MHKKLKLLEARLHHAQRPERRNNNKFRKVALFDDMPEIVTVYGELLSRPEVRVITDSAVQTAEEALSIFRAERPDLVITDLSLTSNGTEGFDILKGIRRLSQTTHVPVALFSSAYIQGGTDDLSVKIRNIGYDALFSKAQVNEVLAFVERTFNL